MRGIWSGGLALAVVLFLSSVSHGQEKGSETPPAVPSVPPRKGGTGSPPPVQARTDLLVHDRGPDTYQLTGGIEIQRGAQFLWGDEAFIDRGEGSAFIRGNVRGKEGDDTLSGARIDVDLDSGLGTLYDGRLFFKKDNQHIEGPEIEKTAEHEYTVSEGSFTTCDAELPAWRIRAREFEIVENDYVAARNAWFHVRDVPVLYSPYFWAPINKERRTGFLFPRLGYSGKEGAMIRLPFYWVIAENADATFTPDLRSKRGGGGSAEVRYVLSKDASGEFFANYLRDLTTDRDRTETHFRHYQVFGGGYTARADVNYLSDQGYYRDLSETTEQRTQTYVDSNIGLTKSWGGTTLSVLTQYTQDLTNPQATAVQRLPEVSLNVSPYRLFDLPAFLGFAGQATNFWRKEGVTGQRLDLYPQLSGTLNLARAFLVTPKAGLRETLYSTDAKGEGSEHREIYDAGISVSTKLARIYDLVPEPAGVQTAPAEAKGAPAPEPVIDKVRHGIEPEISYRYVPRVDQSNLPQFDGIDTIGRQNVVSYSLTNRLTLRERTGEAVRKWDLLLFRLSQQYDLNEAARNENLDTQARRPVSDLKAEMVFRTPKRLTVSADTGYSLYDGVLTTANGDVRWQGDGWYAAVGDRYTRQSTTFLTAETGFKLWEAWDVFGKAFYDAKTNVLREGTVKIKYTQQCWALNFLYQRLPGNSSFFVTLDLKGLGSYKI